MERRNTGTVEKKPVDTTERLLLANADTRKVTPFPPFLSKQHNLFLPSQPIVLPPSKPHPIGPDIKDAQHRFHPNISQHPQPAMIALHAANARVRTRAHDHIIRIDEENLAGDADAKVRRDAVAGDFEQAGVLVLAAGRIEELGGLAGEVVADVDEGGTGVDDGVYGCAVGVLRVAGAF